MRFGWTAAWASMASIACLAACGAGAPRARPGENPRAAPPARFRPAPGTRMFDCPDPPASRICIDGEVEDCEGACGDGDATSCVALARWHVREAGKGGSRTRAVELLGLSCRLGSLDGCYRLVMEHRREAARRDVAAAYAALEGGCARDPACGCARFGSALTLDPRRDREGIALIDAACVRGVLEACDEAQLLEEICERGERSGVCDVLQRQGRVRPSPEAVPQWEKIELPADLTGSEDEVPPSD